MSHRITTSVGITDAEMAKKALTLAGMSFQASGKTITITSGKLNRAVINLESGEVSGDTDYHKDAEMGMLRRHYAEAKYLQELEIQGGLVVEGSRVVTSEGAVTFRYSIGLQTSSTRKVADLRQRP